MTMFGAASDTSLGTAFPIRRVVLAERRRQTRGCVRRLVLTASLTIALACLASSTTQAANRLTLRNGMVLEGEFDSIDKIAKQLTARNAVPGGVQIKSIVVVDDKLRRTFFAKHNLAFPPTDAATVDQPIKITQRLGNPVRRVGKVGAILGVSPFDEFGRRTIAVSTANGRQDFVQQITEISPVYTRLECRTVRWDMRVATSSIPSAQLRQVLLRNQRNHGSEARRDTVRLLFQSDRFQDAVRELEAAMKEYPDLREGNLQRLRTQLQQRQTQATLAEIEHRRAAGQHQLVTSLLKGFERPGVATENLIQAAEMLTEYQQKQQQVSDVLASLPPLFNGAEVEKPQKKEILKLHEEIKSEAGLNNVHRFEDYIRLSAGTGLKPDEKLAVAISGWLLGPGNAIRNLGVASSLLEVRNLVRQYLQAMGPKNRLLRNELLAKIADLEGGTPEYVDELLEQMTPPMPVPPPGEMVGRYEIEVPDRPENLPVRYQIQLPPEYDPYKRYPVVVSLHAAGATPTAQLNWWAGDYDVKLQRCQGQAARHGYIVIAPSWTKPGQTRYEYSYREHDAVLASLRDAMRRFSLDTDRVFLSGHALGGDAAWDIALAHPDIWAGMLVVGARSDYGKQAPKYVTFYDQNAKSVPMYFVFGELDSGKKADAAVSLNRYMRPGYDTIVVEYQGRGNEHFYEEIQRMFDWMKNQRREPYPSEFKADSMRPWDNFFWCTEYRDFPSRTMFSPFNWPVKRPASAEIDVSVSNNSVRVSKAGGAANVAVLLSPEFVDFDKPIRVVVAGRRYRGEIIPSLKTILEDARTRGDRQHVYWVRLPIEAGRRT